MRQVSGGDESEGRGGVQERRLKGEAGLNEGTERPRQAAATKSGERRACGACVLCVCGDDLCVAACRFRSARVYPTQTQLFLKTKSTYLERPPPTNDRARSERGHRGSSNHTNEKEKKPLRVGRVRNPRPSLYHTDALSVDGQSPSVDCPFLNTFLVLPRRSIAVERQGLPSHIDDEQRCHLDNGAQLPLYIRCV